MDDDDDNFCVILTADGRVDGSGGACETEFAVYDSLVELRDPEALEALRQDALWLAWPLARGSFWLTASATPCNPLEELASQIFKFHTANSTVPIDPATSGAEFWTNVTRSEHVEARRGYGNINFHVDKDERAHGEMGIVVNPLLSTVTYLSDVGAPTIVLPHVRVDGSGGYELGPLPTALLVPPLVGRHCRFDGRHLHGAPACFCPEALAAAAEVAPAATAHYERITFLVNIWIGHRPGNCERFERPSTGASLASEAAPKLRAAALPSADERVGNTQLRCDAEPSEEPSEGASPEARRGDRLQFPLEQTETEHRLTLPTHSFLPGLLSSGRVVRLVGSAIDVRPAAGGAAGTLGGGAAPAPAPAAEEEEDEDEEDEEDEQQEQQEEEEEEPEPEAVHRQSKRARTGGRGYGGVVPPAESLVTL